MIKLLGNPHETSSDFDQFDTLFRAHDVYDHVKESELDVKVKVSYEILMNIDGCIAPNLIFRI